MIGVDAISGATVTVVAQNQVLMTSGGGGPPGGLIAPTARETGRYTASGRYSWAELVSLGVVQPLVVKPEQVGLAPGGAPFIELWFGDLNHPDVGRSLLGAAGLRACARA